MKKFIVFQSTFKDGMLAERMTEEGLPAELVSSDAISRYFVYQASPSLLRSLHAAGCDFAILPDSNLDEWLYIYNISLKG